MQIFMLFPRIVSRSGLFLIGLFMVATSLLAQDGPGGVGKLGDAGANLKMWYNAEDINGVANGGNVQEWVNRQQVTEKLTAIGSQPTFNASSTAFGGKKTLNFSTSNAALLEENVSRQLFAQYNNNHNQIFIVIKPVYAVNGSFLPFFTVKDGIRYFSHGIRDNNSSQNPAYRHAFKLRKNCNPNNSNNGTETVESTFTNIPISSFSNPMICRIAQTSTNTSSDNYQIKEWFNFTTGNFQNGGGTQPYVGQNCRISATNGGKFSLGGIAGSGNSIEVAEVIGFTGLNAAQLNIVYNYLYSKYPNISTVEVDNYSFDAQGFDKNVAGIGRRSATNHLSSNSAELNVSVADLTGNVESYAYLGHNTTTNRSYLANSTYPFVQQGNRVWALQKTNQTNLTPLKLSFKSTDLYTGISTTDANKSKVPVLLISNSSDMLNPQVFPLKVDANDYYFEETSSYTIPSGSYIALGYIAGGCSSEGSFNYLQWNMPNFTVYSDLVSSGFKLRLSTVPAATVAPGFLFLESNNEDTDFGGAPLSCGHLMRSQRRWCVSKLGSDAGTVDISLTPSANEFNLPSTKLSYVLLIDKDNDGNFSNAEVHSMSQKGQSWWVTGISLADGNKLTIAADIIKTLADDATTSASPSLFDHKITNCQGDALVGTGKVINTKFSTRELVYKGTAPKNVTFSIIKEGLSLSLGRLTFDDTWQKPALVISPTGNYASDGKVIVASTNGNAYEVKVSLNPGDHIAWAVLNWDDANAAEYPTVEGALGVADANYDKNKLGKPGITLFGPSQLGLHDYTIIRHNSINNNEGLTYDYDQSLEQNGTSVNYQRTTRVWKVRSYNSPGLYHVKLEPIVLGLEDLPAGMRHVLFVDGDGDAATVTDQSVVGFVRQGTAYYAYSRDLQDGSTFSLGYAEPNIVEAQVLTGNFYESSQHISTAATKVLVVKDKINFGYASPCTTKIEKNIFKLLFNTGEDHKFGDRAFTAKASFKLKALDANGIVLWEQANLELNISQQDPEALYSRLLGEEVAKIEVSTQGLNYNYTATTGNGQDIKAALQLKSSIIQEKSSQIAILEGVSVVNDLSVTGQQNKNGYLFAWQTDQCPLPAYQFQLMRLYNIDGTKIIDETNIKADVDWSKALTLDVATNSLQLNLAEGTGYYAWRVAPVGNYYGPADSRNQGNWSSDNQAFTNTLELSGGTMSLGNHVFYATQWEGDKNFIYNRVFTEEGKLHENYTVANGLQQVQQTQALLSSNQAGETGSEGKLIVTQTVYDYSGRPAVVSMPAPVLDANQEFGYRQEFMKDQAGNPYTSANVEAKPGSTTEPANRQVLDGLLSKYYSNANPDKQVPDAEGYPFVRSIYSVDGSSRVVEQGGVGKFHQPGGGHTVRSFISKASDQELIRMFGEDAPSAEGASKTSVTDQNGVTSVTYTDKAGKTLATCLVMKDTTVTSGIEYPHVQLASSKALYNTDGTIMAVKIADQITASKKEGIQVIGFADYEVPGQVEFTVDYSFTPNQYISQSCGNFCVKCGYDIEVKIIDLNTNQIATIPPTEPGGTPTPFAFNLSTAVSVEDNVTNCNTTLPSQSTTRTVVLGAGKYRVMKVITLRADGADKAKEQILNKLKATVKFFVTDPIQLSLKEGGIKAMNKKVIQLLTSTNSNNITLKYTTAEGYELEVPNSYTDIVDETYLDVISPCCELRVPLYKYIPDPCDIKEYYPDLIGTPTATDWNAFYNNADVLEGVANSLYGQTELRIPVKAGDDPDAIKRISKDGEVYGTYTQTHFKDLIKNMLHDNFLYRLDSMANPIYAERDKKLEVYQGYTCQNLINSWNGAVQMMLPNSGYKNLDVNGAITNHNKPSDIPSGASTNSQLNKKDVIEQFLNNAGIHYLGFIEDKVPEDLVYKLFRYERQDRIADNKSLFCEAMFCDPGMRNPGTKTNVETGEVELEEVLNPYANSNDVCNLAMGEGFDQSPCSLTTAEFNTNNTDYFTLGLYRGTVNEYLFKENDYRALEGCLKNSNGATPPTDGGTTFEEVSRAKAEEDILKMRDKLLNDCNTACSQKYDQFYQKLKDLYRGADGKYYANPKTILSAELQANGKFDGTDGWSTPYTLPKPFNEGTIDLTNTYLVSLATLTIGKTYRLYFDVVEVSENAYMFISDGIDGSNTHLYKSYLGNKEINFNLVTGNYTSVAGDVPRNRRFVEFTALGTNLVFTSSTFEGGGTRKCIIDNVSLKEVSFGIGEILEDDLCCTANSLVEKCKDDCKLTPQYVVCDAETSMKVKFYAKKDNTTGWTQVGTDLPPVTSPSTGATVDATSPYTFTAAGNTNEKNLYVKVSVAFSNGKSTECYYSKQIDNLGADPSFNVGVRLSKADGLKIGLKNDQYQPVCDANAILKPILTEVAGKVACASNEEAPVVSSINVSYSYTGKKDEEGNDKDYKSLGTITYNNTTVFKESEELSYPITDHVHKAKYSLTVKARFIYTKSGRVNDIAETCDATFDLGELDGGSHSYTPHIKYNATGLDMWLTKNGQVPVVRINPNNASNTCAKKDMLELLNPTKGRRILVAGGTAQEIKTVQSILYGSFDLSQTAATGFVEVKPKTDKMTCKEENYNIDWQKSITTDNKITAGYNTQIYALEDGYILRSSHVMNKYSNDGSWVWTYELNNRSYNGFSQILVEENNPLIYSTFDINNERFVVQELSTNGVLVSSTNLYLNFPITQSVPYIKKGDNGYYFLGSNGIWKFDLAGSLLKQVGFVNRADVTFWDMKVSNIDQSLILLATISKGFQIVNRIGPNNLREFGFQDDFQASNKPCEYSQAGVIVKFSSSLDYLWHQVYDNAGSISWPRIQEVMADGSMVLSYTQTYSFYQCNIDRPILLQGKFNENPNSNYGIFKLNKDGALLWDRAYGGEGNDEIEKIYVKNDGTFILIGSSNSAAKSINNVSSNDKNDRLRGTEYDRSTNDVWMIFLDQAGNKLPNFEKAIGGRGNDVFIRPVYNKRWDEIYTLTISSVPPSGLQMNNNIDDIDYNVGIGGSTWESINWLVKLKYPSCTPQNVFLKWINDFIPDESCICPSVPNCNCPKEKDWIILTPPPVQEQNKKIIVEEIDRQLGECEATSIENVVAEYFKGCSKDVVDKLTVNYEYAYHHFTLYNYDRSGRLVRTVPPAGVRLLDLNDGINDQDEKDRKVSPAHKMATTYKYNSLGQLIEQTTPDGGTTRFWYNKIGQLRCSQNDKQKTAMPYRYSYTKYDYLGRPIEAGEARQFSQGVFNPATYQLDEIGQTSWPTAILRLGDPRIEYSVTTYSSPINKVSEKYGEQRYLNNRVSYVYTLNTETGKKTATYYSYDPHGNVDWLVQDIPGFAMYQVAYEYDLISNKVTKVKYNEGQADQFFHRYEYDADNRITAAYTSKDNELWDRDAKYEYYLHGPLKRTVLGEDKVQGLDYTYTLQGWLKAVNSHRSGTANDPGQDGAASSSVAPDEYGMALQYHAGDFVRNASVGMETLPLGTAKNLYNGNISAWASRTPKADQAGIIHGKYDVLSQAYRYDELNRIVSSKAFMFSQVDGDFAATEDYSTFYAYDANGNINRLLRQGYERSTTNAQGVVTVTQARAMDDLRYHYDLNGSNNKLLQVEDLQTADNNYGTDFSSGQQANNYEYDGIGNLTKDQQEGIEIKWNASGKVSEIVPLAGSNKPAIKYTYDASGNRIIKEITPTGGTAVATAYVRDASGNVMAVYKKELAQSQGKTVANFTKEETHLYGSSRLGMLKDLVPVASAVQGTDANQQYKYKDTQLKESIGENVNWMVPKTESLVAAGPGNQYSQVDLVSLTAYKYNGTSYGKEALSRLSHLPANVRAGIFSAEDENGLLQFYGIIADNYLGLNNVTMLFDKNDQLMANGYLAKFDAGCRPVVMKQPGNNKKYILVGVQNYAQVAYQVDMALQGNSSNANQPAGAVVGNVNLPFLFNAYYRSGALAAVEDKVNNKSIVYTLQYRLNAGAISGLLAGYIFTTDRQGQLKVEVKELATLDDLSAQVFESQLSVSPDGKRLLLLTSDAIKVGWLDHQYPKVYTFELGIDYLPISNQVLAYNSTLTAPVATLMSNAHVEWTADSKTAALHVSQLVNYNNTTGSNAQEGLWVFDALSNTLAYSQSKLSGPLARGRDGNNYIGGVIGTTDDIAKLPYSSGTFGTPTTGLGAGSMPPYLASSPIRRYTLNNGAATVTSSYLRNVGKKSYELSDHLGNVTVVVSDRKVKVQDPVDYCSHPAYSHLDPNLAQYAANGYSDPYVNFAAHINQGVISNPEANCPSTWPAQATVIQPIAALSITCPNQVQVVSQCGVGGDWVVSNKSLLVIEKDMQLSGTLTVQNNGAVLILGNLKGNIHIIGNGKVYNYGRIFGNITIDQEGSSVLYNYGAIEAGIFIVNQSDDSPSLFNYSKIKASTLMFSSIRTDIAPRACKLAAGSYMQGCQNNLYNVTIEGPDDGYATYYPNSADCDGDGFGSYIKKNVLLYGAFGYLNVVLDEQVIPYFSPNGDITYEDAEKPEGLINVSARTASATKPPIWFNGTSSASGIFYPAQMLDERDDFISSELPDGKGLALEVQDPINASASFGAVKLSPGKTYSIRFKSRKDASTGLDHTVNLNILDQNFSLLKRLILLEGLMEENRVFSYTVPGEEGDDDVYVRITINGNATTQAGDKFYLEEIEIHEDYASYRAEVLRANNYYAFGMEMPGMGYTSEAYRYGYNGKEKDPEGMGGGGATYDYGFRIYNAQIGKFLSVDPLTGSYPWYTPYQFAGNMPIVAIDLDGLEEKPKNDEVKNSNIHNDDKLRVEAAIEQAQLWVNKNPGNSYSLGAVTGKPGDKIDCSGMIRMILLAAGVKNPDRGWKAGMYGVEGLISSTKKIWDVRRGDLITFSGVIFGKWTKFKHIGIITEVKLNGDKDNPQLLYIKMIHSGGDPDKGSSGPQNGVVLDLAKGNNYWFNLATGYYRWTGIDPENYGDVIETKEIENTTTSNDQNIMDKKLFYQSQIKFAESMIQKFKGSNEPSDLESMQHWQESKKMWEEWSSKSE